MRLARCSWLALVTFVVPSFVGGLACGTGPGTSGSGTSSEEGTDAGPGGTAGTVSGPGEGSGTAVGATSMTSSTTIGGSMGSDDTSGCPAFADEASPGPVSIEVVNMRAEGVWLPMSSDCIEPVPFTLVGPDGAPVAWRPPACGTCEGAAQGQCPCPPPFCDEVTGLFIEPGATVRYAWSGLAHVDETLPDACPGIDDCGAACQRAVVAPDGSYAFSIEAGGAMGCAVAPCGCTPMDGSCTLLDPGMMFTDLVGVEATLVLPGESVVQIVID